MSVTVWLLFAMQSLTGGQSGSLVLPFCVEPGPPCNTGFPAATRSSLPNGILFHSVALARCTRVKDGQTDGRTTLRYHLLQ